MMLGRRTHPVMGKISELFVPVNRATFSDAFMAMTTTSPRSPLDFKIFSQISPRKNPKRIYDNNLSGGVGLGIIAALENSGRFGKFPVSSGSSDPTRRSRSDPIPVANNNRCPDERFAAGDEDYTYVTCHRGPDGSYTRVFRDGGEYCCSSSRSNESQRPFVSGINGSDGFSGVRPEFLECSTEASAPEFQCLDFLSACYLCKKKLHGQDIYMYRGEKAFCSVECRSSHITMDERKEKCRSDFSTSPYAAGQIFSTGVLVI